jgi:hypothetical protein
MREGEAATDPVRKTVLLDIAKLYSRPATAMADAISNTSKRH